jgi:hypothetical protein
MVQKCADATNAAARSAGFAVLGVRVAVRAVLLQTKTVRVVSPVLLGDVVAVLAHLARQSDLGSDIGGCHWKCLSSKMNVLWVVRIRMDLVLMDLLRYSS